jgi:REP element-mobilizing transposase RayT
MADKFRNKYRIASIRLQNWDYRWNGKYFITICTHNMHHLFGKIENGKMILSNVGVLADVFWHEIKNHAKNVELDAFVVMPNHIHGIIELKNEFDYGSLPDHRKKEVKIQQLKPGDPIYEILQEVNQSWEEDNMDDTESADSSADSSTDSKDRACPVSTISTSPQSSADSAAASSADSTADGSGDSTAASTARACPGSTVSPSPPPAAKPPSPGSLRFQNIGKNSISSIIGSYKSAVSKHAHRLGYPMEWQSGFWDSILRTDQDLRRVQHYINNNPKKWKGDHLHGK